MKLYHPDRPEHIVTVSKELSVLYLSAGWVEVARKRAARRHPTPTSTINEKEA